MGRLAPHLAFVGSLNRSLTGIPQPGGRGITVATTDAASRSAEVVFEYEAVANPFFMHVDGPRRRLYTVSLMEDAADCVVSAFRILPETGRLELVNAVPVRGTMPCHVTLWQDILYVANFSAGCRDPTCVGAVAFRIGRGGEVVEEIANAPLGEGSRMHATMLTCDGAFALLADLGRDEISVRPINRSGGFGQPLQTVVLPAGAGPRHLCAHPGGRWIYVVNEYASTVALLEIDGSSVVAVEAVSTLPPNFDGPNSCAGIQGSADGRFVYVSNRGHDSIATFAVGASGHLTLVGHAATGGATPIHFDICKPMRGLLVANQNTGTICLLNRDQRSGRLGAASPFLTVASPTFVTCRRFAVHAG